METSLTFAICILVFATLSVIALCALFARYENEQSCPAQKKLVGWLDFNVVLELRSGLLLTVLVDWLVG